jgi:hypothetical protein
VHLDGSIARQVEDERVPAALGLDPELGALVVVSRPPLLNDRAGDVSRIPYEVDVAGVGPQKPETVEVPVDRRSDVPACRRTRPVSAVGSRSRALGSPEPGRAHSSPRGRQ